MAKSPFRWRASAHNNEQKLMVLSLDEFLRRFLLHVLPKGFVRIRHFGFLATRRRATTLPLCFQLFGVAPPTDQEASSTDHANPLRRCPKCGAPMTVVERLTATEIQLRSPPPVPRCSMNSLSLIRILRAPRLGSHSSAFPPHSFFLPAPQTTFSVIIYHRNKRSMHGEHALPAPALAILNSVPSQH